MHIHGPGHFLRDTLPLRYVQINPFLAVTANGRVIDDHTAEKRSGREAASFLAGVLFPQAFRRAWRFSKGLPAITHA